MQTIHASLFTDTKRLRNENKVTMATAMHMSERSGLGAKITLYGQKKKHKIHDGFLNSSSDFMKQKANKTATNLPKLKYKSARNSPRGDLKGSTMTSKFEPKKVEVSD
jgi:hypothetical protein